MLAALLVSHILFLPDQMPIDKAYRMMAAAIIRALKSLGYSRRLQYEGNDLYTVLGDQRRKFCGMGATNHAGGLEVSASTQFELDHGVAQRVFREWSGEGCGLLEADPTMDRGRFSGSVAHFLARHLGLDLMGDTWTTEEADALRSWKSLMTSPEWVWRGKRG